MADIKYSEFLEKVLEHARNLRPDSRSVMTAEKFFAALLDLQNELSEDSSELRDLKAVMASYKLDADTARDMLESYLASSGPASMVDGIYMQKKTYDARAQAAEQGGGLLTADILLKCILSDPSDVLKGILKASANPSAAHTDSSVSESESDEETKKRAALEAELSAIIDSMFGVPGDSPEIKPPEKPKTSSGTSPHRDKAPQTGSASSDVKIKMVELVSEVKKIRKDLQSVVFGQDNAINVFVTGYFQASMLSMIDNSRKRPKATFLFAGPPGVGKTFLAEKVADSLGLPFMRFDMSEYSDKEANIEFCGSDKVYKNAKAGNVTSFVAEHPKCVLLFDEIEKAHLVVIHLFLQMLDAGRLRDNFTDKEVSFRDAVIILTTNAGKRLYEEHEGDDLSTISRKVIIKALQKDTNPETGAPYFPGAICSRFASGNVVMFNHIGAHNLVTIAKKEILRHAGNLEKESGIHIEIDEKVYSALLFSEGSAADARTIRSRAETFFNDELFELLRLISSEKVNADIAQLEKIQISIDLSRAKPEITGLFSAGEKPRILMLADSSTVAGCTDKLPGYRFIGVQTAEEAVEVYKKDEIDFVLLDVNYGLQADLSVSLNIEDVESPARNFFKFLREQGKGVPVYLLEEETSELSEEEKVSFARQGVRGTLRLSEGMEAFAQRMETIASALHQQKCMEKLAKENKLVSFETAQTISADGKLAKIKLFDFTMAVAVDAEDAGSILSGVSKPNVRFSEVIGAGEAKKELEYFVSYLRNPRKYMGTGVKAPKGVLMYGPPGTGKTMLAKAMACESGVTFIAAEGNQFLKKYVGEGPEKVHELFRTARKYAPAILFIDEIDAIAKERKGDDSSSGAVEATLTAFLAEMDGFASDPTKPVFVLAATNFEVEPGTAKSLDPALMRRFDRRVYIDLPNKQDRIEFLRRKISANKAMEISDAEIENIAMRSTGMSLAALDSVVELALRSAIREGSTKVTDAILEDAFETFNNGEVKKWDESQLERVARHEAGHAFLCWQGGETPSYLTIVARGNHGGYMQHEPKEGKAIYTKDELLAKIRTKLGGRAAELVYYGHEDGLSTGASGDLASATDLAHQMICTYGMDEEFGLATLIRPMAASDEIMTQARLAVNRILVEQMEQALKLISENRHAVDALVDVLMTKNSMTGREIDTLLSSV